MNKLLAFAALALLTGPAHAKDSKRTPSSPPMLGMPAHHPDLLCRADAADAAVDFATKHLDDKDCMLDGPVQVEEEFVTYRVKVNCHGIHAYEVTTKHSGEKCKAVKVEVEDEKPVMGRPRGNGNHKDDVEEEHND